MFDDAGFSCEICATRFPMADQVFVMVAGAVAQPQRVLTCCPACWTRRVSTAIEAARPTPAANEDPMTFEDVFKAIVDLTAAHFGVSPIPMMSTSRAAEYAMPRHVSMCALRFGFGMTVAEIGRFFNRHYSTVVAATNKMHDDERLAKASRKIAMTFAARHPGSAPMMQEWTASS